MAFKTIFAKKISVKIKGQIRILRFYIRYGASRLIRIRNWILNTDFQRFTKFCNCLWEKKNEGEQLFPEMVSWFLSNKVCNQ